MLVHPNPMVRTGHGSWRDTHLHHVEVKPLLLNFGRYRERWSVWAKRRPGGQLTFISRHITEEQAVVVAQTLANRKLRLKNKKKKRKVAELEISQESSDEMMRKLGDALRQASSPLKQDNHLRAQDYAREIIRMIQQEFKLK